MSKPEKSQSKPRFDKVAEGRLGFTLIPNTLMLLALKAPGPSTGEAASADEPALEGPDFLYIWGVLHHWYNTDKRVYCSCLRIAKMFGVSERTITRSARKLHAYGWIKLSNKDGGPVVAQKGQQTFRDPRPLIAELAKLDTQPKNLGRDVTQPDDRDIENARLKAENALLRAGKAAVAATPDEVVQPESVEPPESSDEYDALMAQSVALKASRVKREADERARAAAAQQRNDSYFESSLQEPEA